MDEDHEEVIAAHIVVALVSAAVTSCFWLSLFLLLLTEITK